MFENVYIIIAYIICADLSAAMLLFGWCVCRSMLAEKLNMAPEAAERWIVNLIRNARLDAKIDSK